MKPKPAVTGRERGKKKKKTQETRQASSGLPIYTLYDGSAWNTGCRDSPKEKNILVREGKLIM